jgi:hypothetical protein
MKLETATPEPVKKAVAAPKSRPISGQTERQQKSTF